MKIAFTKMHGAGNDFVMVDDRNGRFPIDDGAFIRQMSTRCTGIGCDGVILLQPSDVADLRMRFINPDGGEQSMCGNGARCFARMAYDLGAVPATMRIETGAGIVRAEVLDNGLVRVHLTEPSDFRLELNAGLEWPVDFVNTGVPHAVAWVNDVRAVDLLRHGRALRRHALFAPQGTNANFAQVEPDGSLAIRTYERGVEAETLACGTGAVAVALLAARRGRAVLPVAVHCAGGFDLVIGLDNGVATLTGGAERVFDGEVAYGDRI